MVCGFANFGFKTTGVGLLPVDTVLITSLGATRVCLSEFSGFAICVVFVL